MFNIVICKVDGVANVVGKLHAYRVAKQIRVPRRWVRLQRMAARKRLFIMVEEWNRNATWLSTVVACSPMPCEASMDAQVTYHTPLHEYIGMHTVYRVWSIRLWMQTPVSSEGLISYASSGQSHDFRGGDFSHIHQDLVRICRCTFEVRIISRNTGPPRTILAAVA